MLYLGLETQTKTETEFIQYQYLQKMQFIAEVV